MDGSACPVECSDRLTHSGENDTMDRFQLSQLLEEDATFAFHWKRRDPDVIVSSCAWL